MGNVPTTKQLQRVTGQIMALLSANAENVRPVFDFNDGKKEFPSGQNILGQLMQKHRFDAVRCELLGVTLTVEICTDRKGPQEQEDETQLRYCTASCELFRRWLFKMMPDAGMTPNYPAYAMPMTESAKRTGTVKMNLGKSFSQSKAKHRR